MTANFQPTLTSEQLSDFTAITKKKIAELLETPGIKELPLEDRGFLMDKVWDISAYIYIKLHPESNGKMKDNSVVSGFKGLYIELDDVKERIKKINNS